jgi:hypothetical protein
MAELNNYNLNPFIIPEVDANDIGFLESVGIGAAEALPTLSYNLIGDQFVRLGDEETINEDEWKASSYWRKKLKYHPKLTWDWAQQMSERHDENLEFSRQHERMGFSGEVGSFLGGMATGFIDPVNWLALPAGIGISLARQTGSKIVGAALFGGLTNMATEAALSPLRYASAQTMQEKYGVKQFAAEAAISGTLGLFLGGAGGAITQRRSRRKISEVDETTETFQQTANEVIEPTDISTTDTIDINANETRVPTETITPTPDVEKLAPIETKASLVEEIRADNKLDVTPATEAQATLQIKNLSAEQIADTINRKIKDVSTDAERQNILMELARIVPRDTFLELSKLTRNKRGDRKIAAKRYRELFDDLAGVTKTNELLSLDTMVGAVWDKANDEHSIIDPQLLFDTIDSEYVRVVPTTDMVPENVGRDRFVVFEPLPFEGAPNIEGTKIGLARATDELIDAIKRKGLKEVSIRVLDADGDQLQTIGIDNLEEFLDGISDQAGLKRMEAVINGETVDAVAPIERLRETHFDTLESSWNNIKQMYNQHTADDVADAADELVTAAKTPEDMAEIAQNLRNQTGDDPLINTLLDDAVDTSNNLQAQREALRAAYVCLVS